MRSLQGFLCRPLCQDLECVTDVSNDWPHQVSGQDPRPDPEYSDTELRVTQLLNIRISEIQRRWIH